MGDQPGVDDQLQRFVGTDGVTNLTELPQASTLAQTDSPVGDYAITLTGGSAVNYRLVLYNGTLT